MTSPFDQQLVTFARVIDAERARALESEFLGLEGAGVAVLLATAFPPLRPARGWQLEAVARLTREGFRVQRQRSSLLGRLRGAAGDPTEAARFESGLKREVWSEKARIALRELLTPGLGGAGIEVTARELSDLADVSFEVALDEARARVAERFGEARRRDGSGSGLVVLGLGKLGGQELNAGSDVDVMFVYDTDEGSSELLLHDHWTRVARRLVQLLESPSEDGMIWRVDLRLRPEGSQGPIVNSVAAIERYYETWGRLWERAALLRARPIAGDRRLGAELEREIVLPFVYRREVDPELSTALVELVQRSRAELSSDPARDLKLGPGGIREAEFFVQSLQLIWGGREPSLRVPGTLAALGRLRSRGLVSDREAQAIAEAYVLLRRVEHRIQWATGIQTHLLPEAPEELGRLSRSLGFEGSEVLLAELDRARSRVSELFSSLPPSAPRPPPKHRSMLARLDTSIESAEPLEPDPAQGDVLEHLRALARRPDGLLGALTRERHAALGDQVLEAILNCADPEQAARYLRSFFARFVTPAVYVNALAEDPRALRRMATVLGASVFVGDVLVGRPDLADVVVFGGGQVSDARAAVDAELETFRRALPEGAEAYEARDAFVTALRRARSRLLVEVAVADLAGSVGTRQATRTLSELADAIIDRAVAFALGGEEAKNLPLSKAHGLAVLAVGKLGGQDIGYGSDLDVLFVYDPDAAPPGRDPGEYFGRSAQRVIALIAEPHPAGPGYDLDTRLRPSGSHGLLVTSLSSFARYHGVPIEASGVDTHPSVLSSGAAWERQALLRARFCAGDAALGARAIAIAEVAAYERGAPPVEEMHRLRLRMQHELARERQGRYDLKTGQGGLLDIEFATQWLQMRFGTDPVLRTTDTAEALDELHAAGHVGQNEYDTLRDGYVFLRRLEQRIHVFSGTSSTVIDVDAPGLTQLARRMGFQDNAAAPASAELIERYREVTRAVRAAYERVLELDVATGGSGRV